MSRAIDLDIVADLEASSRRSRQVCSVERLRRDRPDLAEQLDLAIGRFSDARVAAWVTAHGFAISDSTVRSHRVGACQRCRTT